MCCKQNHYRRSFFWLDAQWSWNCCARTCLVCMGLEGNPCIASNFGSSSAKFWKYCYLQSCWCFCRASFFVNTISFTMHDILKLISSWRHVVYWLLLPLIRSTIFTQCCGKDKAKLVTQINWVDLNIDIQYEIHLKTFTFTVKSRYWKERGMAILVFTLSGDFTTLTSGQIMNMYIFGG